MRMCGSAYVRRVTTTVAGIANTITIKQEMMIDNLPSFD
jgi:hypothetical protein